MATERRLIDANALLESQWWDSLKNDFDKARAKIIVMSCPTIDAVEVVRCKDCKHYHPRSLSVKWDCKKNMCCRSANLAMPPDGFCSYGERRTDNG